jgi:hypothetical protein
MRRVVIWGHPLHSHTHSYVHEAFARGFAALGWETIWTNDPADLEGVSLDGALFLTEGQVMEGMPYDPRARYVLHNAQGWEHWENALAIQVYTGDTRARWEAGGPVERINDYTFAEPGTLYQPWATDLLAHEFDFDVPFPPPEPYTAWVGTIGDGVFGNREQLQPFFDASEAAGVPVRHRASIERSEHIDMIRSSLLAPAIVGAWQLEHEYVPCRIFKNISYGRLGVTNSPFVQSMFEAEVPPAVFEVAVERSRDRGLLREQMREVQARHTYASRIETILAHLP